MLISQENHANAPFCEENMHNWIHRQSLKTVKMLPKKSRSDSAAEANMSFVLWSIVDDCLQHLGAYNKSCHLHTKKWQLFDDLRLFTTFRQNLLTVFDNFATFWYVVFGNVLTEYTQYFDYIWKSSFATFQAFATKGVYYQKLPKVIELPNSCQELVKMLSNCCTLRSSEDIFPQNVNKNQT